MLNIESLWRDNQLIVLSSRHGESAEDLRANLGTVCGDSLLLSSAQTASFGGADALCFTASQAADFLLSIRSADDLPQSTRIWKWLADFVLDRIAAGQIFPTVEAAEGSLVAVWRPLVTAKDELEWLGRIAKHPALRTADQNPEQAVESFINTITDLIVRRTLVEDAFFANTAARCQRPDAGVDSRFFGALLTEKREVAGLDPDTASQIRSWVDALQERPITATFRVGFRLEEEPLDEQGDQWRVIFLMIPLHGDHDPIPAERLWEIGRDLPPLLGRSLAAQRQSLIDQLQRAAEAWHVLGDRLPLEPASVDISAAEAIAFARQWADSLTDAGFSVELPRWARDPNRELSIQLDLSPADAEDLSLLAPGGEAEANRSSRELFGVEASQMGLSSVLRFDWRVAVGNLHLSEEQFQSILTAPRPLVRFNGEWLPVDVDAARRAAEFVAAHKTGTITLADALRTAHATSRSDSGLRIGGLSGSGWIGQLLTQSPDAQVQDLAQPRDFAGSLRPYQLRGLQWMAFLHRLGIGVCLADDMGLGKTIQFIALLLHERQTARERNLQRPGPTLLFAPTSVIGNWRQEMSRFAPDLTFMVHHGIQRRHGEAFCAEANASDLVITTYALASRDAEDFEKVRWHRLALDEAQKIKNPSAASTQAIRHLPAGFRVALTGTPIENHLSELWSIMDILNPGLLGSASAFREQFAVPIERVGDASRANHLRELIKPFILRRTKSDPAVAGDLPEKLEMKVYCNLTVEQAAVYQRITDEMLGQIDAASGIRRRGLILAALTRLKQVCDHPALLDGKLAGFNARASELDERSGKCERLVEMLEEVLDEGDSALVFTQYKEMGDILETFLARRLNAPVLYLHGGTPASKRDEMIKQFQDPKGSTRVFLLSLRAGGLGLNLTRANHVFHFDRWWNPAVEQQATDRAHRIGQTRQVQVHKYVCVGTMEERIDRMISDKMQLADRIITSGDEWLTSLSTDELRKTLELSADAVEDIGAGGAA